ncbi:MAG: BppU family phage baseplate upper protein [Limosilactobacillus vaginalis]|uniref:BppU family phage baseplate upper protein n=1 Tax=Limosilactobacillus vaginalis TaxID=1633 RepID=UPI0038467F5D|nr:BppU family phage baseplate upper protein [Lactobacillus sp.]
MANNTYVTLDIMKQADGNESTYVNLTPNFQGRVGDSRASVDLWLKRNGLPLDLTKREITFSGVDPQGKQFNAIGFAYYNKPGADMQAGRVNFYFPAGTFQTEGQWDPNSTYFTVKDDKGKVSTIGVLLNVLPNMVEMGINAEPFETDLDRALAQFKAYMAEKQSDIDNAIKEISALQGSVKALDSTVDFYKNMITANAVPTKSEMHQYVDKLMSATEWSGDLNLCTTATTYIVNSGASNNPTSVSGNCLLYVKGNNDLLSQMLVDNDQNFYVRSCVAGKWSAWREQVAWS